MGVRCATPGFGVAPRCGADRRTQGCAAFDYALRETGLGDAPRYGAALLVVEDRGAGIPEDIADALGSRFVSRKDGGLGLGVLLSSASIERLGGEVTLHDREGGGTRWEVRLPVTM